MRGLGEAAVALLLADLVATLCHFEASGVCHRDIKPENLLLRHPAANSASADLFAPSSSSSSSSSSLSSSSSSSSLLSSADFAIATAVEAAAGTQQSVGGLPELSEAQVQKEAPLQYRGPLLLFCCYPRGIAFFTFSHLLC